jgi:hypothetical protein
MFPFIKDEERLCRGGGFFIMIAMTKVDITSTPKSRLAPPLWSQCGALPTTSPPPDYQHHRPCRWHSPMEMNMTPENMMKTLRLTYRISNLPRETQKIIVSALVDINFGGCKHDALEKMKQELKELELDG